MKQGYNMENQDMNNKPTLAHLITINEYPQGYQREGYWYETIDQVARQAAWIASQYFEDGTPEWTTRKEEAMGQLWFDRARTISNAPYFWAEIFQDAATRETEWIDQYCEEKGIVG